MAVPAESAGGGIIFSASHNPKQWNALKLLNAKGEFISAAAGQKILEFAEARDIDFCSVDDLGAYMTSDKYITYHIDKILELPVINREAIASKKFKVVIDCINSTGAIALPPLLDRLGVDYVLLNAEVTGEFAHNPEPLPENLSDLAASVKAEGADMGISVDPDVDRLVFVCEDGSMFSEEYTIVAAADFILAKTPGSTVSNMSSTRALRDVTRKYGFDYSPSAVGEVNVVLKMKEIDAVIGGEGNGGVIYPELHYGRDALVGIAMVLNHLADKGMTLSELKASYPSYHIIKEKIAANNDEEVAALLSKEEDGVKVDFEEGWVHVRSSNTEPIIRIIAEADTAENAKKLINNLKEKL